MTKGRAVIGITVKGTGADTCEYSVISKEETVVATGSIEVGKELRLEMDDVFLWSAAHPYLYTIRVRLGDDREDIHFGIRTLTWDRDNGMRVNGKRILLRGGMYPLRQSAPGSRHRT